MTLDTRTCQTCKGTGINVSEAFTYQDHSYPRTERPCHSCQGTKEFAAPSATLINLLIRNPKTGKLYSTSLHTKAGRERAKVATIIERRRAQYVWRMARFHSGADGSGFNIGGAIMADIEVHGDPWKPELDAMADQVADECYGKGANMRAAVRWNRALHGY